MKIPLDYYCVMTGLLCPRCQEKVRRGEVQEFEIGIMRELLNLEKQVDFKFLVQTEYVQSHDSPRMLVILIKSNLPDAKAPPNLRKLERRLSRVFKKKVKVINVSGETFTQIASHLLWPARILTVSTTYLPTGDETLTISVPRSDARYLRDSQFLEQILSKIAGKPVRIRVL